MNLFRRSSTGGEDHHSNLGSLSEAAAAPAATNAVGGGAGAGGSGLKNSFCRVFLPRSRTTSSCNLDRPVAASTASPVASASQSGTTTATPGLQQHHGGKYSASTEWSYLGQKHKRTASLSRNLTRRSRSVTMPNIEAGAQPSPFSTFHGSNGGSTGLSIPPKPPRKTNNNKPQQQSAQKQQQQHQPEVSKNDLGSSNSLLKTASNSNSSHSSSYISPYGTISHHSRPPSQPRVSHNRILRLLRTSHCANNMF